MKTINATNARRQFFNLIKRSVKGHEEFRITHKDGDAILLSDEDYESLLETLGLLSTHGFIEGYRKAKEEIETQEVVPMKEVILDE